MRSTKLGCPAIGLLGRVMDLPPKWIFSKAWLIAICADGETAVDSALADLKECDYLVRTQLHSNESIHNCFEYVYSFFDVPVSKEEADELEAVTRRKAITIREGGRAKNAVSSTAEKQHVENPYPDNPSAETPMPESNGQYNNNNTLQKNQLLSDKSSIIPAVAKPTFNIPTVERQNDGYNAEEVEYYTEVVKHNISYGYLGDWLTKDRHDGYKEADNIVGFIVDEICSPLPYTTLRGQAFPRSVIQPKMLQADINMVENVLVKMAQVDNIKDFRKYFISSLYNEVLTYHFNDGCESRWAAYAVARDFGYAV